MPSRGGPAQRKTRRVKPLVEGQPGRVSERTRLRSTVVRVSHRSELIAGRSTTCSSSSTRTSLLSGICHANAHAGPALVATRVAILGADENRVSPVQGLIRAISCAQSPTTITRPLPRPASCSREEVEMGLDRARQHLELDVATSIDGHDPGDSGRCLPRPGVPRDDVVDDDPPPATLNRLPAGRSPPRLTSPPRSPGDGRGRAERRNACEWRRGRLAQPCEVGLCHHR